MAAGTAAFVLVGSGSGGGGGGGKSGDSGRRALTADEANRLAITRFRNYQAGGRALTITVPSTGGGLTVTGAVDYRAKVGYGVVRGTGRDTSSDGLIEWSSTAVLILPMTNAPATAPSSPPTSGWYRRPVTTAGSSLDSALTIALGLGSDRPDNAELLPQNGAARLGQDEVRGHRVVVMSGPKSASAPGASGAVRYWVGSDGTMYRVRADLASEPQPVVVDFDTHPYVAVRPLPGVTPTPSS